MLNPDVFLLLTFGLSELNQYYLYLTTAEENIALVSEKPFSKIQGFGLYPYQFCSTIVQCVFFLASSETDHADR